MEAGVEVRGPFHGGPSLVVSNLPAGWVARCLHLGPYDRIFETHRAILRWCAAHGRRCSGDCWEIYQPWQNGWDDNPGAIRTEVFHLIEPSLQPSHWPTTWVAASSALDVGSWATEFSGIRARLIESVTLTK